MTATQAMQALSRCPVAIDRPAPSPTDELAAVTGPEIVRRYELARQTPGPVRDRLRRELELRASRSGSVEDDESGVSYSWDDESESVVRRELDRGHAAAKIAAMGGQEHRPHPHARPHIVLGRQALEESHPGRRVR